MNTKTFILIILTAFWSCIIYSQEDSSTEKEKAQPEIQAGKCERKALQQGDFGKHFLEQYQNYEPDIDILNKLKNRIYNYSITIVLGTWCRDSKEQVPRFFKILDNINYNTNDVKIICIDRSKKAGDTDISDLNIERVPTFIFYENNLEKGRIIETPQETLEKDIQKIISDS